MRKLVIILIFLIAWIGIQAVSAEYEQLIKSPDISLVKSGSPLFNVIPEQNSAGLVSKTEIRSDLEGYSLIQEITDSGVTSNYVKTLEPEGLENIYSANQVSGTMYR